MKNLRISTLALCSFIAITALFTVVTTILISKMNEIGSLAGDLNGRMVAKTRIADDIVDLGQQIRFVDAFLLQSSTAGQDGLVSQTIEGRLAALRGKTAAYLPYIDSDLERSLLRNLDRSRSAYLAVQSRILAVSPAIRSQNAEDEEQQLATAFDQANRMARGLAHVAENEAREAREQAAGIARQAEFTSVGVASLAFFIGLLIALLLRARIFRPLVQLTQALLSLAEGKLDVVLSPSGRGDEIDAVTQALNVFRNNAIALAKAHEETQAAHRLADSMARHDVLTGLPNRRVLTENIKSAIARSERRGQVCGVLVLDLDRFKPVNDIYGHGAGDKVLCQIAGRLNAIVRGGEIAARLGGDEFAIVIEFERGTDAAIRLAKRVIASLAAPIAIDGTTVMVGSSIGIALWPSDGEDAESLLRAADLAMFKAKRDERGSFRFFEPEMDIQLRARADLEARIRQAILQGDVRPHFQPLVDLKQDKILGFEILARWHDGDAVIPPGDFISIAEEAGLIPELTYSVLRQACRSARGWPGYPTLALNITPAQISDLGLPAKLLSILAEESFPAERLELEITENALIGDMTAAKAVIAEFRQNGIRISLDDFGTGYSSLNHLRELKFDKIKIDRSFVQSMTANPDSEKIIETIINLGKSLGMHTIAEGIENVEHLDRLIAYGCEHGQGYFLGKPLGADMAGELLVKASIAAAVAPAIDVAA